MIRISNLSLVAILLPAGSVLGVAHAEEIWSPPSSADVRLTEAGDGLWKIRGGGSEFAIESARKLDARPGQAFEVSIRIRVEVDTRAVPELACYGTDGRAIPGPSALEGASPTFSTNWQQYRRVLAARPGTVAVGARVRGDGRGSIELADLQFRSVQVDTYQTGVLVNPPDATLRKGLVLESNFAIVNRDRVTNDDRDSDGKWALVMVDLDEITRPKQRGEDWRSRFEHNPDAIFWSDGAVLKSDSARESRDPDLARALHFRAEVRPGPYRVLMSDPGRAVAVSRDGRTWSRHQGGREIDLGTLALDDGVVELWLDACERDRITVGPAYFDYVRLIPVRDPRAVERLTRAAARVQAVPARGSVGERRVEVHVLSPPLSEGITWPVYCGLPVPRGELATVDCVAVETTEGLRVPCQAVSLGTWPDGSVKWVGVDFLRRWSRGPDDRYRIVYGNDVRGDKPVDTVTVRPLDDGFEVDTGAVRFRVPGGRFGVVEDVRSPSGAVLQRGPLEFEVVEAGGRRWRAAELPVRTVVEKAGPLHAVILIDTGLPASGRPSTGFAHRVRVHAYAGSPVVRLEWFIANTDSRPASGVPGSMASQVAVVSVRMTVRPGEPIREVLTELGPAGPEGALVQKTEEIAVAGGSEQPRKLTGWLSSGLTGGGRLALGVEGFREQFPKAIRWHPDRIELDLWAEEGGTFDWIEGVGKTHHLSLLYVAPAAPAGLPSHGRHLAAADPWWYCSSGVFGPIGPSSSSPLPAVERSLARHMRESVVDRVGLGFENYGDHSSGGYVKGSFLWDNNEYDLPAACFVHFARTGDAEALRVGLAAAQHYVDVDTVHYSSRHADWAGVPHTHSHATFGHHTAQGPNMNHAGYVQGLILASYLTGDPTGLKGAEGIASWVLRNLGEHSIGMERQLGHPLMTLNDVYAATGDERWLRGSANLVDQALRWEHPLRGGFLAPITESPAYTSGSPFCGGLITAALLEFNSRAKLPEIARMLERSATWTLTDVWKPPAGIVGKGGSPRRDADPRDIASHSRLMVATYERTRDPFYLVVPRLSVVRGFGDGSRPFGTRATGLVFNYLPWFLQALNDNGNPQEDTGLVLIPDSPRLTATRGQELVVRVTVENRGGLAVSDLVISCHARLDFEVAPARLAPRDLPPGGSTLLTFKLRAPANLNPTCEYNNVAFVHISALARRDGRPRLAHAHVPVVIGDENKPRE